MADKSNERDILAENAKLKTDLETLQGRTSTLETQNTTLRSERDEARGALTTANQLLSTRDGQISTLNTENTTLKNKNAELTTAQTKFDERVELRVAEETAKHGIRPGAVAQPKGAKPAHEQAQGEAGSKGTGTGGAKNYTAMCQEHVEQNGAPKIEKK